MSSRSTFAPKARASSESGGGALQVARVCAGIGVALGALAPSPPDAIVVIPLATLLALVGYRPTERFSPLFVDGALLVGSLIAVALA